MTVLNDRFGNRATEAILPDFNISSARQIQRITTNCSHGSRQEGLESNPASPECKGKGKAVPLQAWTGPEGSRKLRFPDFVTTAQDGGKVVSLTHRPPLPLGNTPGTHFC